MKKIAFILLIISFNVKGQNLFVLESNYIPYPDTSYVFTPQKPQTEQLPLVIMLHGYAGNYKQWSELADLQKYADSLNIVIACPDAFFDSYYINSPVRENYQYESFFFEVFLPSIIKNFNINKNLIFITGLSMGGHGAISFYLKRPELFVTAASTSGLLDLTAFPNRNTIKGSAGNIEDYSKIWEENSCTYLVKNIAGKNKTLYIDCGTEDFLFNTNQKFLEICKAYNINVTYNFSPGSHTHNYWRNNIPEHFKFFMKFIK